MTTNPALADLQFLAGAWDMELSQASFLPDPDAKVHGSVRFEWIEQGAGHVDSLPACEPGSAQCRLADVRSLSALSRGEPAVAGRESARLARRPAVKGFLPGPDPDAPGPYLRLRTIARTTA